jgi:hypothetical protein
MSARITWYKRVRKSVHLRSTIESLMVEINQLKKKSLKKKEQKQMCRHVWLCLKERCHNKGDGRGKYRAYKCQKCSKFERRYSKNTSTRRYSKNRIRLMHTSIKVGKKKS